MKNKKHIVTGILAHVDAGKTTLSEAILYTAGNLRKIGRVDNGDAFLDTYELERSRGITIFSKQAEVSMNEMDLTLLDTPGHVDFSAEMERTLQVLDYAVLVISGADGVQGHTLTLWSLLERYKIPTFLFINKMDQDGTQKDQLLKELQERLSSGCIDFGEKGSDEFYEMIAMEDEALLDHYLESGEITESKIREMIAERKIFPCFFGSALKLQGVNEFLSKLEVLANLLGGEAGEQEEGVAFLVVLQDDTLAAQCATKLHLALNLILCFGGLEVNGACHEVEVQGIPLLAKCEHSLHFHTLVGLELGTVGLRAAHGHTDLDGLIDT